MFFKISRKNEVQLTIFIPNYFRLIFVSFDNQNSFFHLFENMFQNFAVGIFVTEGTIFV